MPGPIRCLGRLTNVPSPLPRRRLAGVVATVLAVSGCGVFGSKSTPHPTPTTPASSISSTAQNTSPSSSPSVSPAEWSDCGELGSGITGARTNGFDITCTKLPAPVDYAKPDGGQTSIFVVRLHWRQQQSNQRVGSLVFNPGGPGVSGVTLAVSYASIVPDDILNHFDFVSFDPRGIGLSNPLVCATDRQKDQWAALDPDVRTARGRTTARATATALAQGCVKKAGTAALAQYNTEVSARDLDRVRQAVGDDKLTYLGFSYGTMLGAQYAHLFPDKVRAAVLDGPVDPTLDTVRWAQSQANGFETEYRRFGAWCTTQPGCRSLADVQVTTAALIRQLDRTPLRVSSGTTARSVTGGIVTTAALYAMYDKNLWQRLASALLAARNNDGTGLLSLADDYNERDSSGHFTNVLETFTAYTCNDDGVRPTDAQITAKANEWARKYPVFGLSFAASLYSCTGWPDRHSSLALPSATTAPAILVIGTTHDPATPFTGAAALAHALGSGVVLTAQGDGHTAYPGTPCIRTKVDGYLISLTVPDELSCPAS